MTLLINLIKNAAEFFPAAFLDKILREQNFMRPQ
jgi:hypothetical protein